MTFNVRSPPADADAKRNGNLKMKTEEGENRQQNVGEEHSVIVPVSKRGEREERETSRMIPQPEIFYFF